MEMETSKRPIPGTPLGGERKFNSVLSPSINPEKIWLKNNTRVYLLPYDVHYEENNDKYAIWYTAPEHLFNSPEFYFNYE